MAPKKQEVKCPWCGDTIPVTDVKVKINKNDKGTIIERSCSKCGKVLAAYLEEEGDFLPKIRVF